MALVISDRIKETTNTVGTQTYQLEGAVTGFETFAANLSDGDTTYYAVTDNTNFEVGLGTINEGTSQTINYTVTVANVGGVNVFVLNGVNNPVITFVKGFTYVFDVSDNTNGSHPLRFRTSADASYTDGVSISGTQGQAGATVTIVVASDAPSSFKYYCTSHGNAMGNTINVISAVATLARTTILASSNSNNAVSFGTGAKTIFCTLPASKTVLLDASGNATLGADLSVGDDLTVNGGVIELKNTGAQSELRMYCEFSNQHYAALKAPAHNDFSGNTTLTLPATTDTIVGRATTDTLTNKTLTSPKINENVAVTATATELNILDGVTATATELNKLDGVTATTTELNYVDVTTLGTVEASKAVTADANGDVKFSDDDILRFGTGSDLRIFHDGGNNIFRGDSNPMFIQTDNTIFLTKNNNAESMAKFIGDGAVELYHNNVKKFETTSDGATVTGDLTTTADIELGHASDTTIARASAGVVTIEGNTVLTTGNSDTPTTTTSSSDADFVLVDDGGTMKKITPANLGITSGSASKGFAVAMAIAL